MLSNPRVDAALDRSLELGEVGVQVAAYLDGELVIDTWVGIADETTQTPVGPDTLFSVFSATKGILATTMHLQAERGYLDIDDPVVAHWPEYGVNGKQAITIRQVMQHRAGVPHMPSDLTPAGLHDWDAIIAYIESVEPVAVPGERTIYHPLSMGYILGEILRRTDPKHRRFGQFVREELCAPLGIDDLWVGIPPEQESRMARLTLGANPPEEPEMAWTPMRKLSMPRQISPEPETWNSPLVRQADIPAGGAIMTARAGARLWAMIANGGEIDGVCLLSRQRLLAQTAQRDNPEQIDEMQGQAISVGAGGYWLSDARLPADLPKHRDPAAGAGEHILLANGAGGTIGWADLDTRLAVMITHNRMFPERVPPDEHPFRDLGNAIRESVGATVG